MALSLLHWRREKAVLRFCVGKAQALSGWHAPGCKGTPTQAEAHGSLCWLCSRAGKGHLLRLREWFPLCDAELFGPWSCL